MQTFEEVLTHFHSFLESATYLDVVPCRWGYVRLFNEGDPINFNSILCRRIFVNVYKCPKIFAKIS